MNIFCHIPRENWFCDRYGAEYSKHSKNNVSHTEINTDTDLIWLLAGWCWRQIDLNVLKSKKVICTIHHEVPEKFDNKRYENFIARDKIVDAYHVPCKQTANFISKLTDKPIHILSYWANNDIWLQKDRNETKNKYGLPKDSFVVGSFQRDTEGHDLISPKLEKGPDRFCEYVEKLTKKETNVHVLLNGWRRQYVINRLKSKDIPFTYVELPPIEIVSEMYSACDLYVVGSRWEGGPQAILECALTRTPIVSTNVGIASHILPSSCIIDMDKEYHTYIPSDKDVDFCFNSVQSFLLKDYVSLYDKLFLTILEQ